MGDRPAILVIACGALAHEIVALRRANNWPHMVVQCLPADLHNRPEKIPAAVRDKIAANRGQFASIFVAYADCGTGGQLDAVLAQEGIERIAGAHCYEFFAGSQVFAALSDAEPGTFYLTDFLLAHFDRLILRGLGIDRHPELMPLYFGNYTRLVYLAQLEQPGMVEAGRRAAERLGLAYEHRVTGYGALQTSLQRASERPQPVLRLSPRGGAGQPGSGPAFSDEHPREMTSSVPPPGVKQSGEATFAREGVVFWQD